MNKHLGSVLLLAAGWLGATAVQAEQVLSVPVTGGTLQFMQTPTGRAAPAAAQPQLLGDGSYVIEVYPTDEAYDPARGTGQQAAKVFSSFSTIRLVSRHYENSSSSVLTTVMPFVQDNTGEIVLLGAAEFAGANADRTMVMDAVLPSGTYFFNSIIVVGEVVIMSPTPFPFVVR